MAGPVYCASAVPPLELRTRHKEKTTNIALQPHVHIASLILTRSLPGLLLIFIGVVAEIAIVFRKARINPIKHEAIDLNIHIPKDLRRPQ